MNKRNQNQERLSPQEIRQRLVETRQGKVEKDYKKKLFVLRHKQQFFKYGKIISLVIFGILLAVAIFFWGTRVVKYFSQPEDQGNSTVVEEPEKPPEDFGVEVEEMKIIQPVVGETTYDVVAKIVNKDTDWGVSQLKYKFILKDRFDKVVLEKEETSYILPSQERHLIGVGLEADRAVVGGSLEIKMGEVEKLKEFIVPDITVTGKSYEIVNNKSKVFGDITNNNPYGFETVDIGVILYDTTGNIVGLNFTNLNSLAANSKRSFAATWGEQINDEVDRIYIEPTVNAFKSELFMKSYGSGTRLEY